MTTKYIVLQCLGLGTFREQSINKINFDYAQNQMCRCFSSGHIKENMTFNIEHGREIKKFRDSGNGFYWTN